MTDKGNIVRLKWRRCLLNKISAHENRVTWNRSTLIHFMPPVSFYTPWKYQKTRHSLIFWRFQAYRKWPLAWNALSALTLSHLQQYKREVRFCKSNISFQINKALYLIIITYNQFHNMFHKTFQCFTKFSSHHKWNDGRLLLINMVYTSCLARRKTKDLRKLGNRMIPQCPVPPPK